MTQNELGVLIGFDEDSEECLIKIQNYVYDHGFSGTQMKSFPYHIIAKTIPYDNKDPMIDLLLKLAQHKAFTLYIDKLIITYDQNCLALHCQLDQELRNLSNQLYTQINKAEIMLLKDNRDLIEQAYQLLLPMFEPFTVIVNKIHLYNVDVLQHLLTVELTST